MKNQIFFYLNFSATILALSACDNSAKNTSENSKDNSATHSQMMDAMHGSMSGMDTMKMTGNFDCDFANLMIVHHQGAIKMSEYQLENGTDADIKAMAQNIISAQKKEIDQMHEIANKFKVQTADKIQSEEYKSLSKGMDEMMAKMHKMGTSGDLDKDFLTLMIPHHEAAVKMANDQISFGKNDELKQMAQKMIEDQTEEINAFKSLLAKQ